MWRLCLRLCRGPQALPKLKGFRGPGCDGLLSPGRDILTSEARAGLQTATGHSGQPPLGSQPLGPGVTPESTEPPHIPHSLARHEATIY
jgi:hypothetical protein